MTSFRLITAYQQVLLWLRVFAVQILAPQEVKEQYQKMILQVSQDMIDNGKTKSELMDLTEEEHEI